MLLLAPSTFLLANDWLSPVMLSPPTRPVELTVPPDAVPPLKARLSPTADSVSALAVTVALAGV